MKLKTSKLTNGLNYKKQTVNIGKSLVRDLYPDKTQLERFTINYSRNNKLLYVAFKREKKLCKIFR